MAALDPPARRVRRRVTGRWAPTGFRGPLSAPVGSSWAPTPRPRPRSSAAQGVDAAEQLPIAGHAPEVDRPERVVDQIRPRRELADRPRHDDLVIGRLAQHSRSDVDADPADVLVQDLDLTCVDGCADLQPELADRIHETERTSERARRGVERRQHAVARRLHDAAMEPLHLRPDRPIVAVQELPPFAVAQGRGLPGGIHDVGEQDGRQDAIHVLGSIQRADLLLRPRERVHVAAGWRLLARARTRAARSPRRTSASPAASCARSRLAVGTGVSRCQGRAGRPRSGTRR